MKAIFFLFLLFAFISFSAALKKVTKIPIKHHIVSIDFLKEKQARKIAKLGGIEAVRALPNFYQKLVDQDFTLDFVTIDVSFGTPWQNFTLLISSGSTRMWILGKDYPNKTEDQNSYDESKSTTSKKLGKSLSEQDSFFIVGGTYYNDKMALGIDVFDDGLIFGSVSKVQELTELILPVDGVLGIDHMVPSVYKDGSEFTAPIDTLLKFQDQHLVVLYLDKDVSTEDDLKDGFLIFGGVDGFYCGEDVTLQVPVQESIYGDKRYNFNVDRFGYGSKDSLVNGHGYIDISLSNIIVPTSVFNDLLKILNPEYDFSTGLYTIDCDFIPGLEVLYVHTTSDKEHYIPINPSSYLADIKLDGGKCALTLGLNDNLSAKENYILGTPVARTQCIGWDFDQNTINLYPKTDE